MKRLWMGLVLVAASLPLASAILAARGAATRSLAARQEKARGAGVEARLRRVVAQVLGVKVSEVRPEAEFARDLGATPLKSAEIFISVEREFGVEVAAADVAHLVRVKDACDYVKRRLAEKRAAEAEARAAARMKAAAAAQARAAGASPAGSPKASGMNVNGRPAFNGSTVNANVYTSNTSALNSNTLSSNVRNSFSSNVGTLNTNASNTNAVAPLWYDESNVNSPEVRHPLRIAERRAGDAVVLDLSGKFAFEADEDLRRAVGRLLRAGERKFALNLAALEMPDDYYASTFGPSVAVVPKVRGQLKLVAPPERVRRLLAPLRLEVYDDEAAALGSFAPTPARPTRSYATRRELEERMKVVIAEALGVEPEAVVPDTTVYTLRAGPFVKEDLDERVRDEFGIEMPDADADSLVSVSSYNKYVWLRLRRRPL